MHLFEITSSSRKAAARTLFNAMVNQSDVTRQDIIDAFINNLGLTHSTAVTYFQKIANELGYTNLDDDSKIMYKRRMSGDTDSGMLNVNPNLLPPNNQIPTENPEKTEDELNNEDEPGIRRVVKGAHLVYKRGDGEGTFEELWIYPIQDSLNQSLKIRKNILAGTDIPPNKMQSPDGQQQYSLITMGNAQLLHITGLPN